MLSQPVEPWTDSTAVALDLPPTKPEISTCAIEIPQWGERVSYAAKTGPWNIRSVAGVREAAIALIS